MDRPDTRYAKTADGVHIAYQVLGNGPSDLLYVPGYVWHLEYSWQHEAIAGFYRQLADSTRLILLDRRGTGMSDRVSDDRLPTIEGRIDDIRPVLDAIGSERAAVFGEFDTGATGAVFAATYPSRCAALILMTPDFCGSWKPASRSSWPRSGPRVPSARRGCVGNPRAGSPEQGATREREPPDRSSVARAVDAVWSTSSPLACGASGAASRAGRGTSATAREGAID